MKYLVDISSRFKDLLYDYYYLKKKSQRVKKRQREEERDTPSAVSMC